MYNNKRKRDDYEDPDSNSGPTAKRVSNDFDPAANQKKLQKEYIESLQLCEVIKQNAILLSDVVSLENDVIRYKGNWISGDFTWDYAPATLLTWMDNEFQIKCKNLKWMVYVITSDLRHYIETYFAESIKKTYEGDSEGFAMRIRDFQKTHPHRDYPSISKYHAYMHKIFTENKFIESSWSEMTAYLVNGLLSKFDMKMVDNPKKIRETRAKKFKAGNTPGARSLAAMIRKEIATRLDDDLKAANEEMDGVKF